jgi:hypothetical protein
MFISNEASMAIFFAVALMIFLFRQELKLPPPPAGVIDGNCDYATDPTQIVGVNVELVDANNNSVGSDITKAGGAYELGTPDVGIPAGTYTVYLHKDLATPAGAWLEGSAQITTSGQPIFTVPTISLVNGIGI